MTWLAPAEAGDRMALVGDDGRTYRYGALAKAGHRFGEVAALPRRGLILCLLDRTPASVVSYLAALTSDHAVFPVTAAAPADEIAGLLHKWQPDFILLPAARFNQLGPACNGYAPNDSCGLDDTVLLTSTGPVSSQVHPSLKLLLRTSGTIGEPKVVRLTCHNIVANAEAIATAMQLQPEDRGATSLPIDFSFGLSILHSHISRGSSVWVTPLSPETAHFWSAAGRRGLTVFCAVPSTCRRLAMVPGQLRKAHILRLFCQAGGFLSDAIKLRLIDSLEALGAGFAAMYGQTEATARITYLPPELARTHLGSVGRVLPGGLLSVCPAYGSRGEVIYEGPTVMLGYARSRIDLARGDDYRGRLATGDVGELKDGYLYLRGRQDRMVKLAGRRYQLEDIEASLDPLKDVAVLALEDGIVVFARADADALQACRTALAKRLGIEIGAVRVRAMNTLPRTASGKTDLAALAQFPIEHRRTEGGGDA